MKRFKETDIKTQAVSDYGMTLELYIESGDKKTDESIEYPLLKIYADEETEKKYLELSSGNNTIQLPLDKIKSFIASAEEEVHSDAWFDKNVFNNEENT